MIGSSTPAAARSTRAYTDGAERSDMSEREAKPLLRRAADVEYEDVDAADGLSKGVLVGEEHGAPNLAIRRFTLAPGGEVPRHTNRVEHEQYVLDGEYVVGIGGTAGGADGEAGDDTDTGTAAGTDTGTAAGTEYTVSRGDVTFIPAGTVHWYRNETDDEAAFICAVPTGDDEIRVVDSAG